MSVRTHRFANGMRMVHEARPGTSKVFMEVVFQSGSVNDGIADSGLTNITTKAALKGTTSRSAQDIAAFVEAKGASYYAQTSKDSCEFGAEFLKGDADEMFEILADMIKNPKFDEDEINKVKRQVIQQIMLSDQEPSKVSAKKFIETAFSRQAYGLPAVGSMESVSEVNQEKIKQRHESLVGNPKDIIIGITGDISFTKAKKLCMEHFGMLKNTAERQAGQSARFTPGDFRQSNNNEQINLFFGFEAPGQDDYRRYAYAMLNQMLSGGMSAPLFQEIREKRGLVYSVQSQYSPMNGSGFFAIGAGTGKGRGRELLTASLDLLGEFAKGNFTKEQLEIARQQYLRSMQTGIEKAEKSSNKNVSDLLLRGRIISFEETKERLEQITVQDVQAACAQMLASGQYVLSGIGPQDDMPSEQDIKEMMAKQVKGIDIPEISKPSLTSTFSAAANNDRAGKTQKPVFKSTRLDNGMLVISQEREGPLSCGAWVGAGSAHETPALNGATHMNEHMMFKGTPSYPAGTIDKIIERDLYGALNAYTSKDRTAYYFYNLAADSLEKAVDICGEMVFEANISEEEFSGKIIKGPDGKDFKKLGERDVVLEEIKRADDNPQRRLLYLHDETVYKGQAYARPVLGTADTLNAMTAEQLRNYRDEFYAPNNVVFIAVGPVNHEDFVKIVDDKYGHLEPRTLKEMETPKRSSGVAHMEIDSLQLSTFILSGKSTPEISDDHTAFELFTMMLAGGKSSPLHREIVDRRQLTTGIHAGQLSYLTTGSMYLFASVKNENIKPLIKEAYEQIRQVASNPSASDLEKVKAQMEMSMLRTLETNRSACDAYGNNALNHDQAVTDEMILDAIRDVTINDIKRVAQIFLSSEPALAITTPKGTNPEHIPTFEELMSMRDGLPKAGLASPKPPRP